MMKQVKITQERMDRLAVFTMLAATIGFFLWHFIEMVDVTAHDVLLQYFPMMWAVLAAALACRGKTWRRKSAWLLALGLGWIFIGLFLGGYETMTGGYRAMTHGVWAFGICYQVGFAFKEKPLTIFLKWLIALWTLLETALAAAGVVLALYDQTMTSMHGLTLLGMASYGRLELLTYCTNSASTLVVSMAAAMIGISLTKHSIGRFLYVLAILVMGVALSLTVTRTAFITLGLLLGLAAACCLLAGLRKQGKLKEWMIRALCILLVLVLIVVGYLGMNKTIELFNAAKISLRAGAEEVSAPTPVPVKTVIQRPLDSGSSVLSNREHAWIAVFKLLTQKPIYLLTGASIVDPMTEVNPLTGMNFEYIHVHNIYLQILLECGIPGFLIMVAFLWIFVRAALKLLLGKDIPMWKRLLPILPITVLTAEMVESLTLLSSNWPALPFMMLFMGLTVRFSEDPKDLLVKE